MPETPYQQEIQAAIVMLSTAVLKQKGSELQEDATQLDSEVRDILRIIGNGTVSQVWAALANQVVELEKKPGMTVQRSPTITVTSLYGAVQVPSPYLWNREDKRGCRPVSDHLGLRHHGRTPAVERALTDFGAEESFGQSSRRFEEHYGFSVGRTTILRVVEGHAQRAAQFVEARFADARAEFEQPPAQRPGVEQLEVQLDGCEIRTGTLKAAENGETTPVRKLPKRVREEAWREVRVGLSRQPEDVDAVYVAKMDTYPEVVGQLFAAACLRGLSSRTDVVGVGDGGNGLKVELEAQFPGLRFILDRPHLIGHLFETADACGLKEHTRKKWIARTAALIDTGQVTTVLDQLRAHKGRGKKRVNRLLAHLTRFRSSMNYEAYREAGLPIASGAVESAHRTIPQKRLKLPGAWWRPDNVNPMLALRVLRANGWWNEFWQEAA